MGCALGAHYSTTTVSLVCLVYFSTYFTVKLHSQALDFDSCMCVCSGCSREALWPGWPRPDEVLYSHESSQEATCDWFASWKIALRGFCPSVLKNYEEPFVRLSRLPSPEQEYSLFSKFIWIFSFHFFCPMERQVTCHNSGNCSVLAHGCMDKKVYNILLIENIESSH